MKAIVHEPVKVLHPVRIELTGAEAALLKKSMANYTNNADDAKIRTRLGECRYDLWCALNEAGVKYPEGTE